MTSTQTSKCWMCLQIWNASRLLTSGSVFNKSLLRHQHSNAVSHRGSAKELNCQQKGDNAETSEKDHLSAAICFVENSQSLWAPTRTEFGKFRSEGVGGDLETYLSCRWSVRVIAGGYAGLSTRSMPSLHSSGVPLLQVVSCKEWLSLTRDSRD